MTTVSFHEQTNEVLEDVKYGNISVERALARFAELNAEAKEAGLDVKSNFTASDLESAYNEYNSSYGYQAS